MKLRNISLAHLRRKKAKAVFIFVGLLVGVSSAVAFMSLVDALTRDINHKLEKYGANILIVPRTENLSLSYGGIQMGGISFDMQELREADLEAVKHIKNYRNIAAMGPMALGAVRVNDRPVMLAGRQGLLPGGGCYGLPQLRA